MNAGLWAALGYAAGSLATLLSLQPVLAKRYQRGKAAGFLGGYDAAERNVESATEAAYRRGKADGFMQLGRDLVRDIGPEETRAMIERMEAMDTVQSPAAGKRAPREPEPPASFTHEDER